MLYKHANLLIGAVKGFVPSSNGSELHVAVKRFYIMAQYLTGDFEIPEILTCKRFLVNYKWNTVRCKLYQEEESMKCVFTLLSYNFQFYDEILPLYLYFTVQLHIQLISFHLYMRHFVQLGNVFPLICVLFCMNVCTMNLNKYSTV
jgi:hypothetical protein